MTKPIFKYSNYSVCFLFLGAMEVFPYFIISSIYFKIGVMLLISYIWLAFYSRIVYVYDGYIEFFFPFRLKPLYRKRRVSFSYAEVKKVIIISGHGYNDTKIKFILFKKRYFLWKYANDSFGIMPDQRDFRVKKLLAILKNKNVEYVLKVSDNHRYLFESDE